MSIQWRIYCTEPGDVGWHYEWSDTAITTCPNNPTHTVNPDSVQEVARETEAFRLNFTNLTSEATSYSQIAEMYYPTSIHGPIRRMKFYGALSGSVTSYDIELYDVTNHVSLITKNFTNTDSSILLDLGVVGTPPTGDVTLAVNGQQIGGTTTSDYFFIDQIVVYGQK